VTDKAKFFFLIWFLIWGFFFFGCEDCGIFWKVAFIRRFLFLESFHLIFHFFSFFIFFIFPKIFLIFFFFFFFFFFLVPYVPPLSSIILSSSFLLFSDS